MRMLLTSQGIHNDLIEATLVELLGRPLSEARVVVVIDAIIALPGDKSRMLEHVAQTQRLGWAEFDVLSLLAGPPSLIETRLRAADVILGYGGTNNWLAHAWTATGLAPVLRDLLEEKVYVGWSAGSMIFCRTHALIAEAVGDGPELELLALESVGPALPLFDWFPFAHLGAQPYGPTDAWAAELASRIETPLWFLDDDSALLVRDPDAAPAVVSQTHWLHFDGGRLVGSR